VFTAWFLYLKRPDIPGMLQTRFARLHRLLDNKYYFDWFNENVIATSARNLGTRLWRRGDERIIDGWLVNGSARPSSAPRPAWCGTSSPVTCITMPSR
jgi:NADH-quinone oxidoreductase subunit L